MITTKLSGRNMEEEQIYKTLIGILYGKMRISGYVLKLSVSIE